MVLRLSNSITVAFYPWLTFLPYGQLVQHTLRRPRASRRLLALSHIH